jgi:tetratricopeptide (TPR) repeat protein
MNDYLPAIYLSGLLILLAGLGVFVLGQIIKTRRLDKTYRQLQNKIKDGKGAAQDFYQLGSIYLDKKLYVQSINLLQKALKSKEEIEPENQALIYNALGFAYNTQEQYELAIRNYKEAIKLNPSYVVALNNLGSVYEKKQLTNKALETYQAALAIDPNNKAAKRRAESLQKRLGSPKSV